MVDFIKPKLPSLEGIRPELEGILKTGQVTTGKYNKKLETEVSKSFGTHTISVSSCSIGMNLLLSTLPEDSEVILPAYTFMATLEAILWNGLKPIIVDVNNEGNIEPRRVEDAITKNTSAVLGVHIYGSSAWSTRLQDICDKNNLKLFFDGAHAIGTKLYGKPIAQFGDACVFSLGPSKPMCNGGEGGLICTKDKSLYDILYWKRQHGHKGDLNSFTFGTNGRPNEIQAVISLHNFPHLDEEIKKRHEIYNKYASKLKGYDILPRLIGHPSVNYFIILINNPDEAKNKLLEYNIPTKRYFYPSLKNVSFVRNKYSLIDSVFNPTPMADLLSEKALALPFHTSLTDEEIEYVCEKVKQVCR